MGAPSRKYNPGFLTDDELVASYCVRTTEFELLVEVLRECTGRSNPHQIVIGPRGSGKTSLLLRVVAEVGRERGAGVALLPDRLRGGELRGCHRRRILAGVSDQSRGSGAPRGGHSRPEPNCR